MKTIIHNAKSIAGFNFVLVFLFIFISKAFPQINVGGEPMSSLLQLNNNFSSVTLPSVDTKKALEEDAAVSNVEGIPFRYGLVIDVDFNLNNSGTWNTLSDGSRIWRLGIKSNDAKSLNLFFNNFYMPKGAYMFVYDMNKSRVLGAFTEINNSVDGQFATALIFGNYTVIEYYEPVYAKDNGRLSISKVVHAYKDISGNNTFLELPCNININCPIGAPWVDQKRSVARMTFTEGGSGFLCTGSLINTTLNDRTPYFLTAEHCAADNWSSLVADFNYESPTCIGTSSGPTQSISGATLMASNLPTDFRLLKFNNPIPASINAYFNGWDKSGASPVNETAIHQPGGAIKKISVDDNPAVTSGGISGNYLSNGFWRVVWDHGMTEGGSSGCPLYDQNKRVIGQNLGGIVAQCENPQAVWKVFGKISESWAYGGSSTNELKDWLDPNNSGVATVDGINDLTGVAPVSNFTSNLQSLPIGGGSVDFYDLTTYDPASWSWSFPGGTPSTSTDRNPTGISYTATGAYSVSLTTTNSFGSNMKTLVNYIKVAGVTLTPISLQSPPTGTTVMVAQNDPTLYTFNWSSSTADPSVIYLFKIKKIGLNPEFTFTGNNDGHDSAISMRKSFMDSLAVTMGLTGDSVRCTWRAAATNGLDTVLTGTFTVNIRRETVGINQISSNVPDKFNLYNNYPNPFNPKTVIKFDISKSELVKLEIYNMLGEEVTTLVNQNLTPGSYSIDFDATGLSSGMYFYRIEAQDFSMTKRMVLVK
jgi:lysyl endopeptidase